MLCAHALVWNVELAVPICRTRNSLNYSRILDNFIVALDRPLAA